MQTGRLLSYSGQIGLAGVGIVHGRFVKKVGPLRALRALSKSVSFAAAVCGRAILWGDSMRLRAGFILNLLAMCSIFCGQSSPVIAAQPLLVPGVSGFSPTKAAEPGQILPLKGARIIEFVTKEATQLAFDLSPDGTLIVFSMLGDLYTLPAQGGEATQLTHGIALDSQPVFAPDGKRIAFLSDRSGAENLWVMDLDGANARQISLYDDDPVFVSPAWSYDGQSLFVSRHWQAGNGYELWKFPASQAGLGSVFIQREGDSTERNVLGAVAGPAGEYVYHAQHDGALDLAEPVPWRIVKTRRADRTQETVYAGDGDARLGPSLLSAFRPAISRDETRLAFSERRAGKTYLRLMDLTTNRAVDIAQIDPDSLQTFHWNDIAPKAAFSPDDKTVYFTSDGKLKTYSLRSKQVETLPFKVRVKAELGPLARAPARIDTGDVKVRLLQHPALSPDGTTVAFSALGRLYVTPWTGGDPRLVHAPGLPPMYHPHWSRDGQRMLSVSWTGDGGGHVWVTDTATGKASRLTSQDAFYTHPVFAPDGSVLVIASPSAQRNAVYLEYTQFREAELLWLEDGQSPQPLATGIMGGKPHFLSDGTLLLNRPDGVYQVEDDRKYVGVLGPNWYFAKGPAHADDLRVSPDGASVIAQFAHQLHLLVMPKELGADLRVETGPALTTQITDVGADSFAWDRSGKGLVWAVGSSVFKRPAIEAKVEEMTFDVSVPRASHTGRYLLRGATVYTMGKAGTIEAADVLVEGDRFKAVGPKGSVASGRGLPVIDVTGHFIIPGLIDVHHHAVEIRRNVLDFEPWGLRTMLAYGVTTAFDPSTLTVDFIAYKDAIEAGLTVGPRLFSTGPALYPFNDFNSYEEVESVLRRYSHYYGLKNIKMYRSGNRRVRQWIVKAARKLGLQPTTEGTLSAKLGLSHILDGYSGNEHALPPPKLYDDFIQLMTRSGISYDLTLQITNGGYPAEPFFVAKDRPYADPIYAALTPEWYRRQKFLSRPWRDRGQYNFHITAESAHRFQSAGGLLGIGSHGDVAGLGFHWEMQAHEMGGMPPLDVLKAATLGGAKTIGRDRDVGSIEVGKLADFLVLKKDPRDGVEGVLAIICLAKGGWVTAPTDITGGPRSPSRPRLCSTR